MGALFNGEFMDVLRAAQGRGELGLTEVAFNILMAKLWKQKWVVYAKRPYREAWHALAYLGRYVHRVGIANSRLLDVARGQVTFRTKGKATTTLPEITFLRRFLLHVLPEQFTKVRHFGLLTSLLASSAFARAAISGSGANSTCWPVTPAPSAPDNSRQRSRGRASVPRFMIRRCRGPFSVRWHSTS
jgi:hypothetical protein